MPIQLAPGTDQIGYLAPPNEALLCTGGTATTTAALFPVQNMPNRRTLMLQNNGAVTVYIGHNGLVTSTTGIAISAGSSLILDLGPNVLTYILSASSTAACVAAELA